jgi:hypothetical protein
VKKITMTYAESVAKYNEVYNEPKPKCTPEILHDPKKWDEWFTNTILPWDKEHDEKLKKAYKNIVPEVGVGCTIIYWSDKRAATVTEIISPCKIKVRHNKVKCIDYYAGDYEILSELCEDKDEEIFTKRSNGMWVEEGQSCKDGVRLSLLWQTHYIDPCF